MKRTALILVSVLTGISVIAPAQAQPSCAPTDIICQDSGGDSTSSDSSSESGSGEAK